MRTFIKKIKYRMRYKGLLIHSKADILGHGAFTYDKNCSIAEGVSISIPGFLTLGKNVIILRGVEIDAYTVNIGSYVSIQKNSFVFGDVTIGSNCLLAPNVFISSGTHEFKKKPELNIRDQDQLEKTELDKKPIIIGEDCWLGINVVILPGVKIGKGCVIGANSVVNRNIPPYSIAAGLPAKVVGERLKFNPPKRISPSLENIPYLYSGFKTSKNHINENGIFLLSNIVEIFIDIVGARFIKLKIENGSGCTVNLEKINAIDGVITILAAKCFNPIKIEFDRAEYQKIVIKEIWTE